MIWPELWPFVLVVVRMKQRARWWVDSHCRADKLARWDLHSKGWRGNCTCPECVAEFAHFFEWRRIR